MKATTLLAAFDLPQDANVEQRIPKTMLHEHGAPTAADKRRIGSGTEQLAWVAALKETTIGVATYRDDAREYLEIALLHLVLRPEADARRLIELVHRAIPYPVLLVAEQGERLQLSLAHKRWSQGETGRTVLDGPVVAVVWDSVGEEEHEAPFLATLALRRQPRANMFTLYQGWIDSVLALLAARRSGRFAPAGTADRTAERRAALAECELLEQEITRLRAAAAKERQIAKLVELNLTLKRVEAALTEALKRL